MPSSIRLNPVRREFKVRHRLLAANAREVVQKLIEAVSSSKVLHKNLNGNAAIARYDPPARPGCITGELCRDGQWQCTKEATEALQLDISSSPSSAAVLGYMD